MTVAVPQQQWSRGWCHHDAAENAFLGHMLVLLNFLPLGQGGQTRAVANAASDVYQLPPSETSARSIAFEVEAVQATTGTSSRELVRELRALTGLTWDRMGALLNVSTRMIHHWQNGESINAKNHAHLAEVVAVMKYIDRGDSIANRELLLSSTPAGVTWFDDLRDGKYELVRATLGKGAHQTKLRAALTREALRLTGPDDFADHVGEAVADPDLEADTIARRPGKRLAKTKPRRR